MKLAHGFALLTVASLATASTWLGCSSSPSTATNNDAGSTTNPDSGGNTNPDSGGGGTDGGGGAQTCAAYCTAVMAACTGGDSQYATTQECMNACSFFPAGAASDTSGFTLGCKIYHAGVAAKTPSPHCWHAGPYGFGGCGAEADSFCALATGWCSTADGFDGGAPPYASVSACTTAFAAFTAADGGTNPWAYSSNGPGAGNTSSCREYHLGAALNSAQGGANQELHCNHVGVTSATCQ